MVVVVDVVVGVVDGVVVGTGSNVSVDNLSVGSHTITFRATDKNGTVSEAQVTIRVTLGTSGANTVLLPIIIK